MKERLKLFRYKIKAAIAILRAEKMIVVLSDKTHLVHFLHYDMGDEVVDAALDISCRAMTARVIHEEMEKELDKETNGMMAEVREILGGGK